MPITLYRCKDCSKSSDNQAKAIACEKTHEETRKGKFSIGDRVIWERWHSHGAGQGDRYDSGSGHTERLRIIVIEKRLRDRANYPEYLIEDLQQHERRWIQENEIKSHAK